MSSPTAAWGAGSVSGRFFSKLAVIAGLAGLYFVAGKLGLRLGLFLSIVKIPREGEQS